MDRLGELEDLVREMEQLLVLPVFFLDRPPLLGREPARLVPHSAADDVCATICKSIDARKRWTVLRSSSAPTTRAALDRTGIDEAVEGSVSHDVAEHAGRPVLIVPPPRGEKHQA
jgi:nucleotide-binding universal stress UspA family protein